MSSTLVANPGKFDRHIQLQSRTKQENSFGEQEDVWSSSTDAWASIVPVRGTDVIRGGLETNRLYVTITMYWQPGITSTMRVLSDRGSLFVIESVENVKDRNWLLVLNCVAIDQQP